MGASSREAGQLRIPTGLCATFGSLEVHEPARGRSTRAVLVLGAARAAIPVLPPDPLEVVHLEDEEGGDPEEDLCFRHVLNVSANHGAEQWAERPSSHARRSYASANKRGGAALGEAAPPGSCGRARARCRDD